MVDFAESPNNSRQMWDLYAFDGYRFRLIDTAVVDTSGIHRFMEQLEEGTQILLRPAGAKAPRRLVVSSVWRRAVLLAAVVLLAIFALSAFLF